MSGLGASQTAEVAYLDKLGLKYCEHDIKDFEAFVTGFGLTSKRIAFPGKINMSASSCIVSFPGKYAQEWLVSFWGFVAL